MDTNFIIWFIRMLFETTSVSFFYYILFVIYFIPYEKHNTECLFIKKIDSIHCTFIVFILSWATLYCIVIATKIFVIYDALLCVFFFVCMLFYFIAICYQRYSHINLMKSIRYIEKKYKVDYIKMYNLMEKYKISRFPIENFENEMKLDICQKGLDTIENEKILQEAQYIFDRMIRLD